MIIPNLPQEHLNNIELLVVEFGEVHRKGILTRYLNQFYISEEDPVLKNRKLSKHVYNRTKEALKIEYL
ncbi:hypothetical protein J4429_03885 [Candidatus Pacearchaeota archaeon]|nr:hypothetical protein [Candidatus Pacearchaeota archaeon]